MSLSMQGIKTVDLMMMPGIVEDKEVISLYTDRSFPIRVTVLHERINNVMCHYLDKMLFGILNILGGMELVRVYIHLAELITPYEPMSITNGILEKTKTYYSEFNKHILLKIFIAKCIYECLANFRSILFIPIRIRFLICRIILASANVVNSIAECTVAILSLMSIQKD